MSLMDKLFGKADTGGTAVTGNTTAAAPNPGQGGNPAAGLANSGSGLQTLPASGVTGAAAVVDGKESSPLDTFTAIWDTPKDAKGNPIAQPVDPLTQPIINFDPAKVADAAKQLDFSSGITPELASAITDGSPEKVTALKAILNSVGQQAYTAAIIGAGGLTNNAMLQNNDSIRKSLSKEFRATQLADTPIEDPALSHPAAAPMVRGLRQMIQHKNPNMPAAEVAKQVNELFRGLSAAMQTTDPAVVKAQEEVASRTTNWGTYFANQ